MPGTEKNTLQQNTGEEKPDTPNDADSIAESFKQAEKDIKKDPDMATKPNPTDDPDKGELARFEGEE